MSPTRRSLAAGLASLALPARAQGSYPERPVRVVIPYAAGGGADTVGRILFAKLGEILQQSFIIENRGGGAGTIGAAVVAKAPADGYTLLHDATAFSVNPSLFDRLSYDTRRDFRPIFLAARVPNLLLVHPSITLQSVPEVIAFAKAQPGGLEWASSGNGGIQHLALEMFARAADIRLNHVPYRGGAPALTDLIAGQIKFYFSNAAASTGHVRAGRVRAIAHTGAQRIATFPDLPRVAETLPGFEAYEWNGVFAPAGVPDAVVARINQGLNAALAAPDVAERLAGLSVEARPNTPAECGAFVEAEMAKWERVVREANIRLD